MGVEDCARARLRGMYYLWRPIICTNEINTVIVFTPENVNYYTIVLAAHKIPTTSENLQVTLLNQFHNTNSKNRHYTKFMLTVCERLSVSVPFSSRVEKADLPYKFQTDLSR